MADVTVRQIYLECRIQAHYKFYCLFIVYDEQTYHLWTRWGKIGTEGTLKRIETNFSREYLNSQMNKLSWKKQAKGYQVRETEMKDLPTPKLKPTSLSNKANPVNIKLDRFSDLED